MFPVTFWLQLLLLVFILKQSDAVSDQCGDLREQISLLEQAIARTAELKHRTELLACQCHENWAKEVCLSTNSSSEVKESEPVKNALRKRLGAEEEVLKTNRNKKQQLQSTIDGVTNTMKSLTKRSNVSGKCSGTNIKACRYLIKAAKIGDVNSTKRWVNCVNDNCARQGANVTPLIYAARACHLDVARVLVEGGADVEASVFNNNTALHFAAFNGCVDVCRLLLDRGANVDSLKHRKYTPLLEAARGGHLSVVKLLVERGADVRLKNEFGRNASEEARYFGKTGVADWLDAVVKKCGLKENACRPLLAADRSRGVDRAKGLAMCEGSDNCTEASFFPLTPQTQGHHSAHVDIASEIRRLRHWLAEVKAHRNSPVMSNDYDQIAKELEDQIEKEFADQIAKETEQMLQNFADQIAKEPEEQTLENFADQIAKEPEEQTLENFPDKIPKIPIRDRVELPAKIFV